METFKENTTSSVAEAIRCYHGGFFKILISDEESNGNLALIDMTLPKGVDPPMHIHLNEDETFYVLKGNITFYIGDSVTKLTAGDSVFAPRNVPHTFVVESESAQFLTLITPGQFLGYFMDFSFPSPEEPKITTPKDPPSLELIEYMASTLKDKYGVLMA